MRRFSPLFTVKFTNQNSLLSACLRMHLRNCSPCSSARSPPAMRFSFPHAQDQLIVLDGQLAGRLMVDRSDAEVLLVDIALLACFRNRGMGTELLGAADCGGCKQRFAPAPQRSFRQPGPSSLRASGFLCAPGVTGSILLWNGVRPPRPATEAPVQSPRPHRPPSSKASQVRISSRLLAKAPGGGRPGRHANCPAARSRRTTLRPDLHRRQLLASVHRAVCAGAHLRVG